MSPIASPPKPADIVDELLDVTKTAKRGIYSVEQQIIKSYLAKLVFETQVRHADYLIKLRCDPKRRHKFDKQSQPANFIRTGANGARRVLITVRELTHVLNGVIADFTPHGMMPSGQHDRWKRRLGVILMELNECEEMVNMPKLCVEEDRHGIVIAFILPKRY